ncbi:LysR family transcriptional regulator [Kitasatospora sp. MMS16-BH015]|uniref:LysR family transcriptional regulator n=1 Tax=Kitasatospora sp. MMS16-BH015 TaxID=2018025 RepID=UPI000CA1FABE|nr:LysR family transcriptional regulator [Kitasatospora sp. MMS16-BH015]AUG77088.1 LysR family transcriptional regulator [Kitasatospora sp. MMS16-BH015]
MDLEVRHLRIICAVAETGSLTRAAAALRLTQPGLSSQLRRIEAMLGGALFERRPSGAVPTAFGEVVLARARAVLPTIDELLGAAALTARAEPRHFRLGSVNAPLLGGVLAAVRERYPAAKVSSRGHGSPVPLVEDVAQGRLEAAVVGDCPGYELPARPEVVLHPVVTEPVFVALPAAHPLAADREVRLADLAEEAWASPHPDEDRTREYWCATFLAAGHRMRTVHEVDGRLLLELVRGGHAVSLCQATFEELPGIAVRPIAGDPLHYRHLLAWHREGPLADAHAELARHATAAYQAAAERSPVYLRWLAERERSG